MKLTLQERNLHNGRKADELKRNEGYQMILKKSLEKIEKARNDGLNSKTIEELRFNCGLVEGLEFFSSTIERLIGRAEAQRKRIKK